MDFDPLWLRFNDSLPLQSFTAVVCGNSTSDSPLATACAELSLGLSALAKQPVPLLPTIDRLGAIVVRVYV